jgi:Lon protease-like protein
MLSEEFEQSFSGQVPIFPLPNVVFFPGTKLPLHIFEPRYRQMLIDVHRGEGLLSVVLLDRSRKLEPGEAKNPPVYPVAGMGRLTRVERLPNGFFNVDLFGLSRIRILEEIPTEKPYRIARVKTIQDEISEVAETRGEEILQRAFDAFNKVLRKYSQFPGEFLTRFRGLPVGMLLDVLAHHVPCDSQKKQMFLEETEPLRRCDKIVEALERIYQGPEPNIKVSALSLFPFPSLN